VAKEIQGPADQKFLPSWVVLGPSWAMLCCFGAILGHVGLSWGHVGAILVHIGVMLVILGLFWAILGSTWPSWGAILVDLEDVPCVLGGPGGQLGHLGVASWPIWKTSHAFWGVLAGFSRDVSHGLGGPVDRESLA
jgi:hypothetical protein